MSASGTSMRTPIADGTPFAEVPAGLPDVASLTRMANAFFAALPGAVEAEIPTSAPTPPTGPPGVTSLDTVAAASPVAGGPAGTPALTASDSTGIANVVPASLQPFGAQSFYFLDHAVSGGDTLAGSGFGRLRQLSGLGPELPGLPTGALPDTPQAAPVAAPGMPAWLPTSGVIPSFYFLNSLSKPGTADALRDRTRHAPFDVNAVRRDFPILSERVNGRPLIWFDNAATTQKPQSVIDRLAYFYTHENSNIHRAAHELAARSTDAYESARATVQRFLGAGSPEEIVFVRGATEAINLVAQSWGRQNILPGDEIVVSHLEHHANIVPWQMLASEKGARLRVIPVDDSGQILLEEYQKLLNPRTKLVSITHVSNALGTIVPVREVTDLAHRAGARVLIDGAQSVSHMPVNVQSLGADFFVFSGHKVFGPTGIGVLYGKADVLEAMPPWQGGGNMISSVSFERTTYQRPPGRFEAGTGNIADAAGLAAALDYISRIGMPLIDRYEHELLAYATEALRPIPGLRLIGTAADKASVLSFVLDGYDPVAVGSALNEEGIAVRAGHHCAEPILRRFGVAATVRPSLAFYNTCQEVDTLGAALRRLSGRSGRRS